MAGPRELLLRRIAQLVGPNVLQLEDPADGWPGYGQVAVGGEFHAVALYVSLVGLSHRGRDDVERRFQNPAGGHPILDTRPDRTMLLLGLWETDPLVEVRRPVLVAADPIRRLGRETRFSIFAQLSSLLSATVSGWSESVNSDGERLTYLTPELLAARLSEVPRGAGRPPSRLGTPLSGPRQRPARPIAADPFPTDPDKVDRGTQAHYDTEERLRRWVAEQGGVPVAPRQGEPQYDLAWMVGTAVWIAEVKSITAANEPRQLRYGLGQLLYYGAVLAHLNPRLALVIERAPSDPVWVEVCARAGVTLCWPGRFSNALLEP